MTKTPVNRARTRFADALAWFARPRGGANGPHPTLTRPAGRSGVTAPRGGMGDLGRVFLGLLGAGVLALGLGLPVAEAAVEFKTQAVNQITTGKSLVVAVPEGTAAGDVLFATVAVLNNGTLTATGWTAIDTTLNGTLRLATYRRVATASESAYTFTLGTGGVAAAAVVRYSGVDTTNPVAGFSFTNGTTATVTAPSVASMVAGDKVIRVFAANNDDSSASPAAERIRLNVAGSNLSFGVADANLAASGPTGPASFTLNLTATTRAGTIVLKAAVASPPTPAAGKVSGTVFADYNGNGVKNSGDTGINSVVVTAYDSAGASCQTTSANGGAYSIDTLTCNAGSALAAGQYRVEFTLPSSLSYLAPSAVGTNNATTVRFVNAGVNTLDVGFLNPADYVQAAGANLLVPRHLNGSGVGQTTAALYSFPYSSASGTTPTPTSVLQVQQVGSLWGIAYQRGAKRAYASAFLKRHMGFGPLGADGVYVIDYTSPSSPALISGNGFKLQGVTPSNGGAPIDLGSVTRTNVTGAISTGAAGDNQLSSTPTTANRDLDAYAKVGTVSYGDIDLTEDENTLWLVNLNQRALIAVDVSTPLTSGTVPTAKVKQYPLSGFTGLPTATSGTLRPFGLKFHKGRGYLGVVADAASSSTVRQPTELVGYVLSFDPENPTAFTTEVTWGFNHNREPSYRNDDGTANAGVWQKWISTYVEGTNINTGFSTFVSAPQPIVSDIEFREDDSLIVGVMDRFSHQQGWANYIPTSGSTTLRSALSTGDTLMATLVAGSYVIESGETDAKGLPTGGLVNDSPGNHGEFFWADGYTGYDATHWETSEGSLAYMMGSGEIASTSLDPQAFNSQGVRFFDIKSGSATRPYQLFASPGIADFGKGAGLGDMEILADPAPIQIGNRVWADTDADGIQDAGESALAGVTVTLKNAGGTTLATATTDSNGNYFFSNGLGITTSSSIYGITGLATDTAGFQVIIATSDSALGGRVATKANADGTANGDDRDSDGIISGSSVIATVNTGAPGENNHTYDFGFVQPVSLGNYVWLDSNRNGIQDGGESGLAGATATLYDATGTNLIATDALGNPIGPIVTDASGAYLFGNLLPGQYTVKFAAPAGYLPTLVSAGGSTAANDSNGASAQSAVLASGQSDPSLDSGFFLPVSLGNYVWLDSNRNGIQDGGESGLAGATATLYDATGTNLIATDALGNPIGPIVTDASGAYLFGNLLPGQYTVKFAAPAGYLPTLVSAGGSTAANDSNGASAQSAVLASGQSDPSLDSGFFLPVSLGNYVWLDSNRNGIQDGGESGLAGATATLYDATGTNLIATDALGNPIGPIVTDASGAYLFGNLLPGQYTVKFAAPAGYLPTLVSAGGSTAANDSNGASAQSAVLASGQSDPTLDSGFVQSSGTVSLGSYIWRDSNNDGVQDDTESPIQGATVRLLDSSGQPANDKDSNPVAPHVTGADGLYYFGNLAAGGYIVEVTPPDGYTPSAVQSSGPINGSTGTNVAEGDSNVDNSPSAGDYRSGLITLTLGGEPTETGSEAGDGQDNSADTDGNMTVDFGFVAYDLALRKTVASQSDTPLIPGLSTVTFDIQVFNQGDVAASNLVIVDYVQTGFTYDAADNTQTEIPTNPSDWSAGQNPTLTIPGPIPAGGSVTVKIVLGVDTATSGQALNNYSEVTGSDGGTYIDRDSTPDGNNLNDVLVNDAIDNSGGDEDDHDIATVQVEVFDLALRKTFASVSDTPAVPGTSKVTFNIDVINQGDVQADGVRIVDYVPTGFTFNAADNTAAQTGNATDWHLGANGPELLVATVGASSSVTVSIVLRLDAGTAGQTLNNYAEIAEDGEPAGADVDSTPDDTNGNEAGPVKDDAVGEDAKANPGEDDEDDHDVAPFTVSAFDLALRKVVGVLSDNPLIPGTSTVTFTIEVINQGQVAATEVDVVDYVYAGFGFDPAKNPAWTSTAAGPKTTIAGPIAPMGSATVTIVLDLAAGTAGQTLVNYAEISDDNQPPGSDADSTPDDSDGETPVKDDVVDEDARLNPGVDDEDDYDVAEVPVPDRVAIGNRVFFDHNDNGAFEPASGELGVPSGVIVELYQAGKVPGTDPAYASTATIAGGYYQFDLLPQGQYLVHIPASEFQSGKPLYQYRSSTGQGADNGNDDSADENGGDGGSAAANGVGSNVFNLEAGNEPMGDDQGSYTGSLPNRNVDFTADFGFYKEPLSCTVICDVVAPFGKTDQADILQINRMRGRKVTPSSANSGDCTGDGVISVNDARACQGYYGTYVP